MAEWLLILLKNVSLQMLRFSQKPISRLQSQRHAFVLPTVPAVKRTWCRCGPRSFEGLSVVVSHDSAFPQGNHCLKAVDSTTDEIAAYAFWVYLPNGYNYLDDPELYQQGSVHPEGLNLAVLKDFSGKIESLRRRHAEGTKPLWCMYNTVILA